MSRVFLHTKTASWKSEVKLSLTLDQDAYMRMLDVIQLHMSVCEEQVSMLWCTLHDFKYVPLRRWPVSPAQHTHQALRMADILRLRSTTIGRSS